jgi:predicted membrane channel-forming protein YqfA (hemolysin III family)
MTARQRALLSLLLAWLLVLFAIGLLGGVGIVELSIWLLGALLLLVATFTWGKRPNGTQ